MAILTNTYYLPLVYSLVFAAIFLLQRLFKSPKRQREPQPLHPSLPFAGHLINLLRYHVDYLVQLSASSSHTVFKLAFPMTTVYVVTDPKVLPRIDRSHKSLGVWPVAAKVMGAAGGHTSKALSRISSASFGKEFAKSVNQSLGSSANLAQLTESSTARLVSVTDALLDSCLESTEVELWSFVRKAITTATGEAIYGPNHPYQDQEVMKSAWVLIDGIVWLTSGAVFGALPRVLSPEAWKARETLAKAFAGHFGTRTGSQATAFVTGIRNALKSHGIPLDEEGRFHTALAFGLIGNTPPSTFWMVYNTFSDASILQEVRNEAQDHVKTTYTEDGTPLIHRIDIAGLRKSRFLGSLFQESIRYQSASCNARQVTEDTAFPEDVVLRKGSYVLLPTRSLHFDKSTWGPDVGSFEPRRFDRLYEGYQSRAAAAFRGFGGGHNLCPGRHLATAQALALLTMLSLRFDMSPISGSWKRPEPDESKMFALTPPPKHATLATISPRAGWNDAKWEVAV